MISKRIYSKNNEIREWWERMNDEKDLAGMRMRRNLTIYPYFRCESGRIDSRLDPDCNKETKCEEFVATKDGRVLLMKPGRTPIYVCEYCYDRIKNRTDSYERYGDSVR